MFRDKVTFAVTRLTATRRITLLLCNVQRQKNARYLAHHREKLRSILKTCQVAGLPASTFYYKPDLYHRKCRDDEDKKLRQQQIERIHGEFPGYG